MPLYVSYGSNMDPARLASRTGADAARVAGRIAVVVRGMRLAFLKRNDDGTAYATLLPDHASQAEGIGYELTERELDALDAAEGVPGHYLRATIEVIPRAGGVARPAVTYLANPARCAEGLAPPAWYLAHFLAAEDLLSPEWVAMLRRQKVAG
ncbi:gamma-glutamylcyclotransferase family protein [Elioraea rosea]|uniref:gamma-glutamylcyclotransferase family protein n=1 Tax=Elioraea rosea TaxID=2492390 RepID=UPI001182B935|nr:gamma-glutamylcyclotransferase family protein [Elioraea rosea]